MQYQVTNAPNPLGRSTHPEFGDYIGRNDNPLDSTGLGILPFLHDNASYLMNDGLDGKDVFNYRAPSVGDALKALNSSGLPNAELRSWQPVKRVAGLSKGHPFFHIAHEAFHTLQYKRFGGKRGRLKGCKIS